MQISKLHRVSRCLAGAFTPAAYLSPVTKADHIAHWQNFADQNWQEVDAMLAAGTHVPCLFWAPLAIEKLAKALWVQDNVTDHPPRIQNLARATYRLEPVRDRNQAHGHRRGGVGAGGRRVKLAAAGACRRQPGREHVLQLGVGALQGISRDEYRGAIRLQVGFEQPALERVGLAGDKGGWVA